MAYNQSINLFFHLPLPCGLMEFLTPPLISIKNNQEYKFRGRVTQIWYLKEIMHIKISAYNWAAQPCYKTRIQGAPTANLVTVFKLLYKTSLKVYCSYSNKINFPQKMVVNGYLSLSSREGGCNLTLQGPKRHVLYMFCSA